MADKINHVPWNKGIHIDYNKKNCISENLITLCTKCHAKTNQKRDYWIVYFKEEYAKA